MKILFVIPVTGFGGIEKMVLEWASFMKKRGHYCDVLAFDDGGNHLFLEINGSLHYLDISISRLFSSKKKLISFFKENCNYNVVHANVSFLNGLVLKCAKKTNTNIRTISHSHLNGFSRNFSSFFSRVFHKIVYSIEKNYINHNSDVKIACSHNAGFFLYGKKDFIFLPNGIDIPKYAFSPKKRIQERNELGIKDEFVILNVGRFSKVKNQMFMVKVFEEVIKFRQNSLLLFAGDGEELDYVREYCQENIRLKNRVKFLGNRRDVDVMYSVADIFTLTSTIEGFPVVAVEAQVSGLPCLLSNASPRETDISGLVTFFEINDISCWVNEIVSVKINENRIEYSKKIGESLYNIDNSSAFLESLYLGKREEK